MNFQPPDAPDHGHCLRCNRFVIEAEQKSGICIDCQDGGSAFPVAGSEHGYPVAGMSMRDYFAAKVSNGLCANPSWLQETFNNIGVDEAVSVIARASYELADAMLAERAK